MIHDWLLTKHPSQFCTLSWTRTFDANSTASSTAGPRPPRTAATTPLTTKRRPRSAITRTTLTARKPRSSRNSSGSSEWRRKCRMNQRLKRCERNRRNSYFLKKFGVRFAGYMVLVRIWYFHAISWVDRQSEWSCRYVSLLHYFKRYFSEPFKVITMQTEFAKNSSQHKGLCEKLISSSDILLICRHLIILRRRYVELGFIAVIVFLEKKKRKLAGKKITWTFEHL